LLAEINGANRDYLVTFLHCVHVPSTAYRNAKGQSVNVQPNVTGHQNEPDLRYIAARDSGNIRDNHFQLFQKNRAEWQKVVVNSLPRLMKGETVNSDREAWLLSMRPVTVSQKECLNCHTRSKRGDTLGVMVYIMSTHMPSNSTIIGAP
jgi:hypothetical protein